MDGRVCEGKWPEWLEPECKFLGIEEVFGKRCYVVQMPQIAETHTMKLWIYADSLNPAKIVDSAEGGSSGLTTCSSVFKNWIEVSPNLWLPLVYEMTWLHGGASRDVVRFVHESIEVNSGLSDDLFDPRKVEVPEPPERVETGK